MEAMPISRTAGETADLDKLYRKYRVSVVRYVLKTFGAGPPDPEDVAQAAFEKFAINGETDRIQNPRAFLIRSAHNLVIDAHRRTTVRTRFANEMPVSEICDDPDASRVLEAKESWASIEVAMNSLDSRRREMLIMKRIHGLSSAEIARRFGCSPTLVKSLIAQALVVCHRALQDDHET